jgi:hypothetical protein
LISLNARKEPRTLCEVCNSSRFDGRVETMGIRKAETPRWRPADEPARVYSEIGFPHSFHYWSGASGKRYLHMVYSLIGCPALPKANYVLVRRYDDGRPVALVFGQTKDDAVSLNLAHLRHEGAKRGANEVHIHLLADTPEARDAVKADLIAAQTRKLVDNAA